MNDRRTFGQVFFILAAFGVVSLLSIFSRPGFASIPAVAVVHLIGTGMCLGGAIVALVTHFRSPH